MLRVLPIVAAAGLACGTGDGNGQSEDTSDPDEGEETWGEGDGNEYARFFELSRVTANQGVAVEIGRDGEGVGGGERNAFLVSGRDTLIRAFWDELDDDWVARNLTARLTVRYEDGSEDTAEDTVYVQGAADAGALDASFAWHLPAERVQLGMKYRVEVFETDSHNAVGDAPDPPPAIPISDPTWVGTQPEPLEIKVHIVPLRHIFDGCESTPEISEQDLEQLGSALHQMNPTQRVTMSLADEPLDYEFSIGEASDFSGVLNALLQRREDDAPDPNVYYYAPVAPCDGGPGIGGQAAGILGANRTNAWQRAATGLWPGSGEKSGPLFVHEIGHLQGRYHVACSGGEEGVDEAYPYEGGDIGGWGYAIDEGVLYPPDVAHDYMTYCTDRWVSDFGWNLTFETIKILTSWDYEDARPSPGERIVVGTLSPDSEQWWIQRGDVTPEQLSFGHAVELPGQMLPAAIYTRPHSDTKVVVARLPPGFVDTEPMHYRSPGRRAAIVLGRSR